MAITPPSDIVLDVARAADPLKYREAAERLAQLSAAAAGTGSQAPAMPSAVAAEPAPADAQPTAAGEVPGAMVNSHNTASPRARRRLDAFGQFEAFVLQSFIQSMLPQKAGMVFGKGTAGEIWKSMLAEKLGSELAQSGQIGIAKRLASGPNHSAVRIGSGAMSPSVSLASTLPYIEQRLIDAGEATAVPSGEILAVAERS